MLSTLSTVVSTTVCVTEAAATRFTPLAPRTPNPSPSPSPPAPLPPGGCVPGRDGVPSSFLGHLMCGDYLAHAAQTAGTVVRTGWPLLVATAVAVTCVRLAWAVWRRHLWQTGVARAVWLEIVPPVAATPAATAALWQLLATLLPAASRGLGRRPRRLVWEVHATPDGMRCGLWVPAGINPTAVVRALNRAWPGVRAEHTAPPTVPTGWPSVGVTLRSTQPDWLPLVDDPGPISTSKFISTPEADRIAAVYDGLAAAGRTGGGLLQVHVACAPGHRVAVLRRATADPHRARRQRGTARLLIVALEAVRATISGALDFVTPGPATTRRQNTASDPTTVEHARQARGKYATAPHLLVAVRAFATGPTVAAARAAAVDIGSGYALLSAHWRPRRLRHPVTAAWWRWIPEPRMHLATVAETAALAGLPAEPSAYGMPAAASRRLPAGRDVFTAPAAASSRTPGGSTAGTRPSDDIGHDQVSDSDLDAPDAWSIP